MLELDIGQYRKGKKLILSREQINSIAEMYIKDFKAEALKTPTPLEADEFVEQYIGYKMRYEYLSHNQSILGTIVFNGGQLTVYDAEKENIKKVHIDPETIIIDNTLLEPESKGRYEFTAFHEAGHSILHKPIMVDENQFSLFEMTKPQIIICRNTTGIAIPSKSRTDEEWREWHADVFSACMKMPRIPVREVAIQALRDAGIQSDCVVQHDSDTLFVCDELLPSAVADFFGTSRKAAKIRLQELKIIKVDRDILDIYLE